MIPHSPRFSPVPSDFGGRALSPTLSASSRTTTSLPTDMSDLSSLDGEDEFEIVDVPRSEAGESIDEMERPLSRGIFDSIDELELSHLSPVSHPVPSSTNGASVPYTGSAFSHLGSSQAREDVEAEESQVLPSRNSLSTLRDSGLLLSSTSSSILRFPDPLDSSFQQEQEAEADETILLTEAVADQGEEMDKDVSDRATLRDVPLYTESSSSANEVVNDGSEAKSATKPDQLPPRGYPFHLDTRNLASKTVRTLISLLVVILASGVMPVWRPNMPAAVPSTPTQDTGLVLRTNVTPLTNINRSLSTISAKASKALIVAGASCLGDRCRSSIQPVVPLSSKAGPSRLSAPCAKSLSIRSVRIDKGAELAIYHPRTSTHPTNAWMPLPSMSFVPALFSSHDEPPQPEMRRALALIALHRLHKPSHNAKVLVQSAQHKWNHWMDEMHRDNLVPMQKLAIREAWHAWDEFDRTCRNLPHFTRQLLASLQKSWDAWMVEAMRIYLFVSQVVKEEWGKAYVDVERAYWQATEQLHKITQELHANVRQQYRKGQEKWQRQSDRSARRQLRSMWGLAQVNEVHGAKGNDAVTAAARRALREVSKQSRAAQRHMGTALRRLEARQWISKDGTKRTKAEKGNTSSSSRKMVNSLQQKYRRGKRQLQRSARAMQRDLRRRQNAALRHGHAKH